ncbi:MAG: YggS family pyridoxal phosphate-dependent enzyme [Bacillota bacterium]|nr:YggS family pyridoxal phosphate-dependent enzyme [Bacillota bacterium]
MTEIARNLEAVRHRIHEACERAGRRAEEITLIAVTKTYEPDIILQAVREGARDLGENRVQEWLRKKDAIPQDVRWHLIGQLQTNKVKYLVGQIGLIHSVDSMRLADEIERRAAKLDATQEILVQVNVAGEEQKGGISLEELDALIHHIRGLKHLRLRGLMNIALYTDDAVVLREDFRKMKCLFDRYRVGHESDFDVLSMGMSGDFEIAIEEGATMIRVGSSIFGRRMA